MHETLPARFLANARRLASQVAHYYPAHGHWFPVGWATMAGIVRDIASGLVELGQQPCEPVALISGSRREWTYVDLAIMSAGGVTLALDPSLAAEYRDPLLARGEIRICIVDTEDLLRQLLQSRQLPHLEHIVVLEPAAARTDDRRVISYDRLLRIGRQAGHDIDARIAGLSPMDAAMFLCTSGTTGPPRSAMLTHGNLTASMRALGTLDMTSSDLGFTSAPLTHAFPRVFQYLGLWQGTQTCHARGNEHLVADLMKMRPTVMVTAPRVLEDLYSSVYEDMYALAAGRKLLTWASKIGKHAVRQRRYGRRVAPALEAQLQLARRLVFNRLRTCLGGRMRQIYVSGGVIAPHLVHSLEACGVHVATSWSMAETCGVGTMTQPGDIGEDHLVATVGRPLPGVELMLAEDGELLVRGGCVFSGYFQAEADTRTAFAASGYLRTGDVARVDSRGCYYIVDRKRDLIVTQSGTQVAPGALESLVRADPRITQVVVVGHGRPHLVALIAVHPSLRQIFNENTIEAMVEEMVGTINVDLERARQIRDFRLLPYELSRDSGELAQLWQLKRDLICERFSYLIEEMYE